MADSKAPPLGPISSKHPCGDPAREPAAGRDLLSRLRDINPVRWLDRLTEMRDAHRVRAQLTRLDDRLLKDIGVSRSEINFIARNSAALATARRKADAARAACVETCATTPLAVAR